MFARVYTFFLLLFVAVCASATVLPRGGVTQCNTGTLQCCNSVQDASSPAVGLLAGLLGIVLGPITGQVGLTCNPISVIGVGGNSCSAQPVCCTGNSFSGLLVLGCTPVNINV
ncbi:putative hydrophobin [Lyophyllum shimeji]|uniref:Hydrophobin n=1 Tax=Lyophyllum shimeji TaxID=47721 RepID=A0A9P3PVE6_LYOSH|nr:putative hydrophobin [Lyophyllum shimeji]